MPNSAEDVRCSNVRCDIQDLAVLDEARPTQRFFPVDRIRSCLTRDKVSWLLNCPCSKCQRDYAAFRRKKPPTEFIDRIVGPEDEPGASRNPSKTTFALFALLIYAEHPLLITGFLMREFYDVSLPPPASFSKEQLRGYCSEFAGIPSNEKDFNRFASEFLQLRPQFAIPRMDSGVFTAYGADTILPFINEAKIGVPGPDGIRQEGANGKVYRFEIYEEYRNFSHAKQYTQFARKELATTSDLAFHLEVEALDVAKTFQDDHIVRMIKTYKHGDTFNIIFPLAKANLDHLLRDPTLDINDPVQGPIESRAAWKQMLGVATALGKIGGPRGTDHIFGQNIHQKFQGVHFDLKPANILIDDKDNWIISDFGQASFKPASETSSRVINQGGTDAYAPPEIDNLDAQFSRRYDIWSLGCIMLEVTTFVVLGYDGLGGCDRWKGLDQVRRTTTRLGLSRREDSRFFFQESYQGKYKVKPGILDFMDFLAAGCLQHQQTSQVFISRILDLIRSMLEPEAERRIEIGEVIRLLRSAIEEASDNTQNFEIIAAPGEVPIGEPDLSLIRLFHWRNTEWKEALIHVFEDEDSNLRICTVANKLHSESNLVKQGVQLVPRYAFRERFTPFSHLEAIYFSDISQGGSHRYRGLVFSFTTARDLLVLQAKLTGQKIVASFPLSHITYRRHASITDRFSSLIHLNDGKNQDCTDLGPGLVQLWSETINNPRAQQPAEKDKILSTHQSSSHTAMLAAQISSSHNSTFAAPKESSREARRQPHQQPGYREVPPRRMVIFIHKTRKILTIPMGRNWRDVKQDDGKPNILQFAPVNKSRDLSFVASVFNSSRPADATSFPGIPLCSKVLRRMEYENRFECDRVDLTFSTPEQQANFLRDYHFIWKEWYYETKAMEKQPGYSPVPIPLNGLPLLPKLKQETSRSHSWNILRSPTGSTQLSKRSKEADPNWRPSPHMGGSRGGSSKGVKKAETTSPMSTKSRSESSEGERPPALPHIVMGSDSLYK